ncbi:hypothetical protein AR686_17640 [Chryseobacterium aquaticum subsp. greenlandense]|uniref:Uncharacterized protein n=1 Tax=Chryseobacterium aquaticum subsp. greenlandense TaxID=345663 RepID=A0A101CDG9_9FLAO|nr:hypothetical protein AR686_17640 [Chryseobacterium aquaticum subsp. greenlandense]
MAEISQAKLKYSSDDDLMRFANRVVYEIDPKFPEEDVNDPNDQFSPLNLALNRVIDYGRRCDLTEKEFMISISMAQKGLLQIDGEKVRFFREINQAHFAQYEMGYVDFKIRDQKYQNAKDSIRTFLTPQQKEITPEELKSLRMENIRKDYHRFNADGKVLATPLFYDLIKKTRGEKIRLEFVEMFLKNFVPEIAEGKITSLGSSQMPKIIKKDVYLEFQDEIIRQYVIHLKLNDQTEAEWINHWENIYDQNQV